MRHDIYAPPRSKDLNLRECGKEQCVPEKRIIYTPKSYHLVHYILAGKGCFEDNGKIYEVGARSVFYIPPFTKPDYYPDAQNPWTYIWIGFDGSVADRVLSCAGFSRDNPVIDFSGNYEVRDKFAAIFEQYKKNMQSDLKCVGLLYQLMGDFLDACDCGLKTEESLSQKNIHCNNARQFISDNYQFPVSVEAIAESVGVSPNYLAAVMKQTIGMSPKQYLTMYRMSEACRIIRSNENCSIKSVAASVGFKDQLQFSAAFRKINNCSPLQYKRKYYLNKAVGSKGESENE